MEKPATLIVLVLLVALAGSCSAEGNGGRNGESSEFPAFDNCPCLAVDQVPQLLGPHIDGDCLRTAHLPGVCLPLNYGFGECREWDHGAYAACSGFNTPAWCEYPWCYVDPNNCHRPTSLSTIFTETGLHYSYSTCGYVDTTTPRVVSQVLEDQTLRVSYPYDSSWTLVTLPNGTRAGGFEDVFHQLSSKWNISTVEVPVPDQSWNQFNDSSYSACVHAIAINETDVCIGSFWVTVERTTMVSFPYSLHHDIFYLVTRVYFDKNSFSDMISRPFLPFQWQLWLVIIASFVLVGLVYPWLEAQPSPDDGSEPTDDSSVSGWASQVPDAVNEAFVGFFTAAPMYSPETAPGKLMVFGFAFFVLVLVSSYTASLTAFFTSDNETFQFSSLQDAMAQGVKICGQSAVKQSLVSKYPALADLYVVDEEGNASDVNVLSGMGDGRCAAAITTESDYYSLRNENCDKEMVGQALLVVGSTLAMRPELAQAYSPELVALHMEGEWDRISKRNKKLYVPPDTCASHHSQSSSSIALGLYEMAGLLIVFALCMLGAIVLNLALMAGRSETARTLHRSTSEMLGLTPSKGKSSRRADTAPIGSPTIKAENAL